MSYQLLLKLLGQSSWLQKSKNGVPPLHPTLDEPFNTHHGKILSNQIDLVSCRMEECHSAKEAKQDPVGLKAQMQVNIKF